MHHSASRSGRSRRHRLAAVAVVGALVAACGGSDDADDPPAEEPADEPTEEPADEPAEEPADEPAEEPDDEPDDEPAEEPADEPDDEPAEEPADEPDDEPAEEVEVDGPIGTSIDFASLPPADGEPMKVALINSEGIPGLDFPDIRLNVESAFDYLNDHGGFGGRPLELVPCVTAGSPETSQACAQEVTGNDVELVLLGLDLFPDYPTYTASGVPVIGMLPILPGDYAADALFLTGGNATTNGAIAAVAKEHFEASTVGIISADNAGANASEASLTAALDVAGISYTTVKGGDSETDAGFQGLMREAAGSDPDLLVSLYADAGCIGTMRGRAALGIEIPVITTAICSERAVLDEVGDDAIGWSFVGVETDRDTPERAIIQEIVAAAEGVEPDEVDPTALGLGGLGVVMVMSLATYAHDVVADGGELTGDSLYQYFGATPGLEQWPAGSEVDCGLAESYPSICSFTFPVAEYLEGGAVETIPGLEAVSAVDYLP